MSFKNPSNLPEENITNWINTMKNINNPEDVISFVKLTFPTIIYNRSESFTKHLELFDKNWTYVSERFSGGVKRDILIIKDFDISNVNNPQYSMVNSFMSTMTKFGFCVRSSKEIQKCEKCDRIILAKDACLFYGVPFSKRCIFYNKKLSNILDME